MIITIIEKEILSNQSTINILKKLKYNVEFFDSIDKAMIEGTGDIYLLSTVFSPIEIRNFIIKFKDNPILLLVHHQNNESINIPLSLGAKDYLMKPVNLDILIHKIKHYEMYDAIKKKHTLYKSYHEYMLKDVKVEQYINQITFPMIITTNNIGFIDQLVLAYANLKKINVLYIPLDNPNWIKRIKMSSTYDKLYISGLETLGIKNKNILFKMLENKMFIISSFISVDKPYETVEILTKNMSIHVDGILTITDYSLMIIESLQVKYPDVKIADKLGYSRKKIASLRNKFNLYKHKESIYEH
jgi:hypothetical protein